MATQVEQPPAESLVVAVRGLEGAVNGLRHVQTILSATVGIVSALFLGALIWLSSDVSALREQINGIEARVQTGLDDVEARVQTSLDAVEGRMQTSLDAVEARMATEFDAVDARVNSGFDAVNARIDTTLDAVAALGARTAQGFDAVNARIDGLNGRVDSLAAAIVDLRTEIRALGTKLDTNRSAKGQAALDPDAKRSDEGPADATERGQ
jgi:hypothetical protein